MYFRCLRDKISLLRYICNLERYIFLRREEKREMFQIFIKYRNPRNLYEYCSNIPFCLFDFVVRENFIFVSFFRHNHFLYFSFPFFGSFFPWDVFYPCLKRKTKVSSTSNMKCNFLQALCEIFRV